MENEVLNLSAALGNVPEAERESLRPLCRAAILEWTERLRPGVTPEDCLSAFLLAAAWQTLSLRENRESVKRFSAGDLTVETGDYERSARFAAQAEELMRPYRRDDRFSFRGVRA